MSTASGTSQDRNPVEALADDFLRRQRGGERPTLEDYCRRHPELADEIREVFPVLIRMEDLRSDGPDDATGDVAVHTATRLDRLGDYRILREVGRGGMGVVYEAEQESLGRRVALKVLPDAALSDAQQVLRFQREARAAARLHHTNIVPVFGVGRDEGHHYYVMQFIPGMGLDAVLDELRRLRRGSTTASPADRPVSRGAASAAAVAEAILTGRFSLTDPPGSEPVVNGAAATLTATADHLPTAPPAAAPSVSLPGASADSLARSDSHRIFFRSVARIGLQVAEALEYANRQGVLHRDVKPSNLLLDPKGNVWVADFGLAKAADAEDITHSGDIVGTVRYMAPERFAGRCDARSDVYALGLTLYELLTLQPAFAAADRHELMRRVMSEEPERLRALVPHLPRDLETVVHKAIDRDPVRRYPTATALAEDLQRFLEDKPIKARRITPAEQAWRWAKRNRAVASLAAGLLLALLGGLVAVSWQWRQAVANLDAAKVANGKAQERFDLAMEAVRAFTTGASEDVILKEKALEGLRKKLLGQSQLFYERLKDSLKGETDRASRSALAEAVLDAGILYAKVDAPDKAVRAHREAIAMRSTLAREQPGDPTARRHLGRCRLALAELFESQSRVDEARTELDQSRAILAPLAREHPSDGGARRLEAECDSLDGWLLDRSGHPAEGASALERARVLYEALIRDAPPYTLPTAVDGPTEYRRGLASALDRLVMSLVGMGRQDEAVEAVKVSQAILEQIASGAFANDTDRQRLGRSYLNSWHPYSNIGQATEANRAVERGLAIFRQLADANPTVTSYRVDMAGSLAFIGVYYMGLGDIARGGRYASRAIAIIGSLPPDLRATAARAESLSEAILGRYALENGRLDEAFQRSERSVALLQELVRNHPDYFWYQEFFVDALRDHTIMELRAGRGDDARRTALRMREVVERALREHPHADRSGLLARKGQGLLIEGLIELRAGRVREAARAADQAVAALEESKSRLGIDRFCVGAAHAFFFAVGRPAGPGRPAEPPGIRQHAERAIAEVREADRLGFRGPHLTAMVNEILGGRSELQSLLTDQVFPINPFRPEPGSDDDEPAPDPRGPRS